jgi:hypothetical protein
VRVRLAWSVLRRYESESGDVYLVHDKICSMLKELIHAPAPTAIAKIIFWIGQANSAKDGESLVPGLQRARPSFRAE